MERIYLDHAATSFPKPAQVCRAMWDYMENIGANVNRGGYAAAYEAAGTMLDTRERLCGLLGGSNPRNVIFTANVTVSLNMLLKGLLRPGDHLVTSGVEHNAVMRPLAQLREQGVWFDQAVCSSQGELAVGEVEALLRENTRAVVLTHASNVCGTILPIAQVGELCRRRGAFLLVDAAQTAGVLPLDLQTMGIDGLAFTGHKGLLGPQGIGGFLLSDRLAERLTPLIAGGTGSFSDQETMPEALPDRFEAGTPNLPGIYGLNAALRYLETVGVESIRAREQALEQRLRMGLKQLAQARVLGVSDSESKVGVISVDFRGRDNAEIAFRLAEKYGVLTRVGLHCAPEAHKTLGSFPQGAVRFSVGYGNTETEIDRALEAVEEILRG